MGRFLCVFGLVLCVLAAYVRPASADIPGERRYNFTTKRYEFYDGVNWYNFNLGLALGTCTKEGELEFDYLLSTYQYCDGTNWIKILGSITLSGCSPKAKIDYMSSSYYFCNGLVWVNLKGSLVI